MPCLNTAGGVLFRAGEDVKGTVARHVIIRFQVQAIG